jgi:hypothetical protein
MSTPIQVYDRVKETTTTTGTGPLALLGPTRGFRSFHETVGVGNKTYYGIVDNFTAEWEIGVGTVVDEATLSRDCVLSSTNPVAPGFIDLGPKPKFVILSVPAGFIVTKEMRAYNHVQNSAATTWSVTHNLNRPVSVTVIDSAGTEIEGEVLHIDDDHIEVKFSAPFSGSAYCT